MPQQITLNDNGQKIKNNKFNNQLSDACRQGDLPTISQLLTSYGKEIDIHYAVDGKEDTPLRNACSGGHLEVVRFLLTSPEVLRATGEHANIHAANDDPLQWACWWGHLDIVKYLLTSTELGEHASIHADGDAPFKAACLNNRMEVIHFFIFELNIEKTPEIDTYISQDSYSHVRSMFAARSFMELNEKLDTHEPAKPKVKL